jgi:DNA repair protein RadC
MKSSPSPKEPSSPHYAGHRRRLRERFLENPQALPTYELLELCLYLVHRRKDTKPLAKFLLHHFRTLRALFGTPQDKLLGIPGVGQETLFLQTLIQELHRRLLKEDVVEALPLQSLDAVLTYCKAHMGHLDYEAFYGLYLNSKGHLIREACLQKGTLDHAHIYEREVVKQALVNGASSLILIHNHPSGDPTPSAADLRLTEKLRKALLTVDIIVTDHLIIGRDRTLSLKREGLL